MNFKFRHTEEIIGIFVLGAIITLLFTMGAILIKQKMLVKKFVYHTQFADAVGLSNATTLNFKGFEIGRIKSFRLNKDNIIDADIIVYENYKDKIVRFSAINKSVNPITSKSSLEFLQGPNPREILAEGSFIPTLDFPEGKLLLLTGKIRKSGDVVSSILANIDSILMNLSQDNNADKGSLFRLLYNAANATGELTKSLEDIQGMMATLRKDHNPEDGALFRTLSNIADLTDGLNTTNKKLSQMLESVTNLSENYKNPDGLAIRMLDPDEEKLVKPLHQTITELNQSLNELNKLLTFLNTQTPEMSSLLNQGNQTLKTTQKTLEGVNNNPLIRGGISKDQEVPVQTQKIRPTDVK